jgi:lipopolysaccharide/colanic/teichoic acid biosynthesis glycosyltransferase
VGQHGKLFRMVKLRSMRQDAEVGTGAVFAAKNDDRITRFGHFLRKTRLDEVPQLWNILRGDMSLVGPRAEREAFGQVLNEKYLYFGLRSSVKPGLTGWAQTRFGYVNDFEAYEQKISLDLYYLMHRSVMMDLMILLQTVKTVLHFRGM